MKKENKSKLNFTKTNVMELDLISMKKIIGGIASTTDDIVTGTGSNNGGNGGNGNNGIGGSR